MKFQNLNDKLTKQYLLRLSKRLSGCEALRGEEYIVKITDDNISLSTTIFLYKDRHRTYKLSPQELILNQMHITPQQLVNGTYMYKKSISGKSRRWKKISI